MHLFERRYYQKKQGITLKIKKKRKDKEKIDTVIFIYWKYLLLQCSFMSKRWNGKQWRPGSAMFAKTYQLQ